MSGHLDMDDKANEYGSVHGFGEQVECKREGPAVVCEVFNGTAKAYFKNDQAIYAREKRGYWSICRVDANGARCRNEFRGT